MAVGSSGTERSRRPDIQGLRALAVLMVVAYHAGLPVPGGFVGVDVFFVISGFVITSMLQREYATSERVRFSAFYARRFKRLSPALALVLAFTMLLSALLLSPFGSQQVAVQTAIGAIFLHANSVIAGTSGYFDASAATNPLLNTWTLSVEEQFYLAFPFILAAGWMVARRYSRLRRAPGLLVGLVAILSFGLAVLASTGYTWHRLPPWLLGYYSPLTRAWEFATGALLALGALRLAPTSGRLAGWSGVLGAVLLGASLWLINGATPFPGLWTLLPVSGTALLLLAGLREANPVTRLLGAASLVRVGDWSYSIYLWHWPLIVFAALLWPSNGLVLVVAALVSFAPAFASFRWLEQPIRSLMPRTRLKFAGLVLATLIPPLVLANAVMYGANARWGISWPSQATASPFDHVAMSQGCTDEPFDPHKCHWGDGGNGTVLLVGDSQAYSYADGVIEAAMQLDMNAIVSSESGCPLNTLYLVVRKGFDCTSWQLQVLAYALEAKPDVVVIANLATLYTRPEVETQPYVVRSGTQLDAANAQSLYEAGLDSVVGSLREADIGVVVIQSLPEPDYLPANPDSIFRLVVPAPGSVSFDPGPAIAARSRAAGAESQVAAARSGTVLYDPIPVLCGTGTCPFTTGGVRVYLDGGHLTRDGSLLLAPTLEPAIRKAADNRLCAQSSCGSR